ncbi:MAG TPA: hypothetical protein VK005_02580 [Acholeplasma sp.]|nr:hypothetical protein [Acholeplasma sp.]
MNYFKMIKEELNKNDTDVYFTVSLLMNYLNDNHLLEKNYISKMKRFVELESNKHLIDDANYEDLILGLTVIYRTDYMSSDNSTYLMYYKNGMIPKLLDKLIVKIEEVL